MVVADDSASSGLAAHLAATMRLDPEASALEFEGEWVRWGELAATADALCAHFDRARLPAGGEVGLLVRNRPGHVATLLATLCSERCLVSFNAIEGDLLLADELRRRRPALVVAQESDWARGEVRRAAGEIGAAVVSLRDEGLGSALVDEGPSRQGRARPGVAVEMLTSGTTGRPKRVDLLYGKIWAALVAARSLEGREGPPTPELRQSVSLVHSPIVHTSGLWRLLETLAAGRRIALLERFSVDGFVELVRRHRPKSVSLVPAAMRMLLDHDDVDPEALASLRAVVSGTAPLPPETADEFERRFGIPVLGVYGATEFAGAVAAWSLADKRRWGTEKRGSVGRALPGVRLRVVDEATGEELTPGDVGVLEVEGEQLFQRGWVRTTDLASIDVDGFLFLHGRSDSVIVRGGFKVHPERIEAVLEEHPAVAAACVVGQPDPRLGHVPVAVIEPAAGGTPDPDDVLAFARERLAGYQVPNRVIVVDALPRTPSMKIRRASVLALVEGGSPVEP